jgi:predicted amidohydrolase
VGAGIGIGVCEDFWHLSVPQLLALDGAQILVNVSSSPGRDLAATNEVGLGTATSWRTLMRAYAQLTTSFVIFCNRVGVEESISFWGGSEVIGPTGEVLFGAPLYDEGLFTVDISLADVRRERIVLPLLRDERPELQVRELGRIVAERADMAPDATASAEEVAIAAPAPAPRPLETRRLRVADGGEP